MEWGNQCKVIAELATGKQDFAILGIIARASEGREIRVAKYEEFDTKVVYAARQGFTYLLKLAEGVNVGRGKIIVAHKGEETEVFAIGKIKRMKGFSITVPEEGKRGGTQMYSALRSSRLKAAGEYGVLQKLTGLGTRFRAWIAISSS